MDTLFELSKYTAVSVVILSLVYICGTVVAFFLWNRADKKSEREIREYFNKLKK